MAQIKIYGERGHLRAVRDRLSATIHEVVREILGLPENRRFHRFIGLDAEDFLYPPDRSAAYTIIEISMFRGRSAATRRALLATLMRRLQDRLDLAPADIEITLFETPRAHWGIRGRIGDELVLDHEIDG